MESLFEQFEGADLDRLVECLQAIKGAGMRVDKYTMAGVNQSSGNVWVMSEDWPGCVYCSIGFDVAWSYSCPECGEEHDFDTFEEMSEYASCYESSCKACKPKFVAGWNMPGYLPDAEPMEFDDSDDALECVRDLMREDAEGMGWSREDAEAIEAIEADKAGEFGATLYGKHYFVILEA
jgi:hypothetical protein